MKRREKLSSIPKTISGLDGAARALLWERQDMHLDGDSSPLLAFVEPIIDGIETVPAIRYFLRQMHGLIQSEYPIEHKHGLQLTTNPLPLRLRPPIGICEHEYDHLVHGLIRYCGDPDFDFVWDSTEIPAIDGLLRQRRRERQHDSVIKSALGKYPDISIAVIDNRISKVPDPLKLYKFYDMVVDLSCTSDEHYPTLNISRLGEEK